MARFHISQRNVIGHAESLSSPYHHELVAALRTQTHGDWNAGEMLRYRALLARGLKNSSGRGATRAPRPAAGLAADG